MPVQGAALVVGYQVWTAPILQFHNISTVPDISTGRVNPKSNFSRVNDGWLTWLSRSVCFALATALQDFKKDPKHKQEYKEAKKLLNEVRKILCVFTPWFFKFELIEMA